MIICSDVPSVKKVYRETEAEAQKRGLVVNENKTKVIMAVNNGSRVPRKFAIQEIIFDVMRDF